MQAAAARGREVAVGQFAEQVVHELDAAGVARLAEDPARQQGVDRVEHVGLGEVGQDVAQQVDVDDGTDDRRGAEHLLRLRRQALRAGAASRRAPSRAGPRRRRPRSPAPSRSSLRVIASFSNHSRTVSETKNGLPPHSSCTRATRSSDSSSGRQLSRRAISSRVSPSVSGASRSSMTC